MDSQNVTIGIFSLLETDARCGFRYVLSLYKYNLSPLTASSWTTDKGKEPMISSHKEAERQDKRSSLSSTNGPYLEPVSQEQPTLYTEDLLLHPLGRF
ncbi:hypothetical protein ACHQM5_010260 [Ranunculus cassubicifolius]